MQRADDRQRLNAIRDRLRARGKRWTVAKGIVLETLMVERRHLSVQQIHDFVAARFPQIERSTVHRVLLALADEQVVHALGQHGEARYGMADQPHHHAVCVGCGRIAEIHAATVNKLVQAVAREVGFRFDEQNITLPGRCHDCREHPAEA